jgi:hypothetical protein
MSKLRKRERGPEEGEASSDVAIVQNIGRLKLKVNGGMAVPFREIHGNRDDRPADDEKPGMSFDYDYAAN